MTEIIKREEITLEVTLTPMQNDFVRAVVEDNKPQNWKWRKYMKDIAVSVGYSPQAVDKLMKNDSVMQACTYLLNNRPINISVINPIGAVGSTGREASDPDILRKPGEPLNSDRQEMFCQEIVADPYQNSRKAALRAGYGQRGEYGFKLLQMPKIRTRIDEIKQDRMERLKADQDDVLRKLVILSNVNLADYIRRFDGNSIQWEDSQNLSRDILYGLKSIKQTIKGVGINQTETLELKVNDQHKSLTLLSKHLGLLDNMTAMDPLEFATQLRELSQEIKTKVPGGEL